MAIPQIQVTGKIFLPDGVTPASGSIELRLSQAATIEDDAGGGTQVVSGEAETIIASDGSVDFTLAPNDLMTPNTTRHQVTLRLADGTVWRETWFVDSTGSDPLEIGDVTREGVEVSSATIDGAISVVDVGSLPPPGVGYRFVEARVTGGAGLADAIYRCMKTAADVYVWVAVVSG